MNIYALSLLLTISWATTIPSTNKFPLCIVKSNQLSNSLQNTTLPSRHPSNSFHRSSMTDSIAETCIKECRKEESCDDCMFNRCLAALYCSIAYDQNCEACSVFKDETYFYLCRHESFDLVSEAYCKVNNTEEKAIADCIHNTTSYYKQYHFQCTQDCYLFVEDEELVKYQTKCLKRCTNIFEEPNGMDMCRETCLHYTMCPFEHQIEYEEECKAEMDLTCEHYYSNEGEETIARCKSYYSAYCEKEADALCPKFPLWAVIVIIVGAVVLIGAAVAGYLIYRHCCAKHSYTPTPVQEIDETPVTPRKSVKKAPAAKGRTGTRRTRRY